MSRFGFHLALGVVAFAVTTWLLQADERKREAILGTIDRHWQVAVELGADPERRPLTRFSFYDDYQQRPFAQTYCIEPHPVIEINERLALEQIRFAVTIAVPHEIAHVMVCATGDREAWKQMHGPPWQEAVTLLVPPAQAEEILGYQAAQRSRSGE